MNTQIFNGVMPALMTPCTADRKPDYSGLVKKGKEMIEAGMSAVVYCGSMGDWPLLTDEERMIGVERLIDAGIPVVVGTGAINSKSAVALAEHAQRVGAAGLMVIPRVLSRGSVIAAQRNHFKAILSAAPDIPAIIYNSPVYGFETKADLFFELRKDHSNIVGFKEFGSKEAMRYAAENITSKDQDLILMIGVDTAVYHGYVNCDAVGAITGIGTALPKEVLVLAALSKLAAKGNAEARRRAQELEEAFSVLASFDEGPELVLFFKYLLVLNGEEEYRLHFNETDELSPAQRHYCENQYQLFRAWYQNWISQGGVISQCLS
ncbi:dihydrodipicolinate synthase family protein [Marinomonas mediterranea]|jgi:Dihydrodipicolinate synthase/N-acetylneuraminate lyase|uniref:Dihydrodipicolinate synthase n=1 Tax=Marinomonas mediterranea (strain ATCC 700492 / JCM 21426 / NBRC 103028 / MMB-1) TaxID=717774 RepID=F2JUL3_MARM1|nr:dihydrodipicolinate synthase family protein [Marinomonas mediterranea]ADZ89346.1 Dihydrodipicolinate synthase [Marinomonas mediterranea MMB-1]WCN15611.1 dihydrodipicolinate synthase family protein [Marinomonas mediterranea MMB-1]